MIRIAAALTLFLASALTFAAEPAEPPPAPSFARVDYSRPDDYRVIAPSVGDVERIRKLAAPLKGATDEATLRAVGKWIHANLREENAAAYRWRTFEQVVDSGVYGGCADYAIVYASLARAAGVPCVFVKTMDADWIHEFVTTGTCQSWRGHVFLEVFIDGKWKLLEPTGVRLFDDYDTSARILPGNRWAYDKGGDPREIVLSVDWERWRVQTAAHFKDFDLRQLPVSGQGRSLDAVYVAADSPVWQAVTERLRKAGHRSIFSFNTDFERQLAHARGNGYGWRSGDSSSVSDSTSSFTASASRP